MSDPVARVYAVSSGSYSDYRVLCACPTKADAEAVAAKLRGDSEGWRNDADVEEFLMVSGDVEKVRVLVLSTTLWDDGTESYQNEEIRQEWPFDSIFDTVAMAWRWVRAPMHNKVGGRLDVNGTDHELVRRTFSDKRAEIIVDAGLRMKQEAKGRVISRRVPSDAPTHVQPRGLGPESS